MNKLNLLWLSVLAFHTAQGASASAAQTGPRRQPNAEARRELMNLKAGSRYMVNTVTPINVLSNNDESQIKNVNGQVLMLTPGSEFEVLNVSEDGQYLRLGLDQAQKGNENFSDITVSANDLLRSSLSEIALEEGLEDDDLNLSDEEFYAARKSRGGMTYCYRDVKNTLLRARVCNHYASGVRAEEGFKILQRECGMSPVSFSTKLPINAVCVMGGGRPCGGGSSCGHISVKVGKNSWFGAGTRGTPWLGNSGKPGYKKRYIIGCLVKGSRRLGPMK